MSIEARPDSELEIAHVLFMDIVGYSKQLVDEQSELIQELFRLVRGTEQFQSAEASGKLIRIPTGDGMALAFFTSTDAPVRCAMEVSKALKDHPQLRLRMGIHSGPVEAISDVNDRMNVAGAGINMAQRVMDCGDHGHILLSKRVADDLGQYRKWQSHLHSLGEVEVKHGVRLEIVNFYTDELGNPVLPEKIKKAREQNTAGAIAPTNSVSRAWMMISAVTLITLLAFGFWRFWRAKTPPESGAASAKSIAVLPFENMSEDKQNAYFADGMQDEILTDLAKIGDLKVISRSSVMDFKSGSTHNIREIGRKLRVAHVLEGSVQRAGNRVRVTAQLIDAGTDAHLWAEHYDRPIDDVFAIQSEIAKKIAEQLKAHLSPAVKQQIEEAPTHDVAAYDLFLRASSLLSEGIHDSDLQANTAQGVTLLTEATRRDPDFAGAWSILAIAQNSMYEMYDHTPDRLALAEEAVQKALHLRPNEGPPHFSAAVYYFSEHRDDYRGRQELALAQEKLPNSWPTVFFSGVIAERDGRWQDMIVDLEKAYELSPRDRNTVDFLVDAYRSLRRYDDARRVLDQATAAGLNPNWFALQRGQLALNEEGTTAGLRAACQALAKQPEFAEKITRTRIVAALDDGQFDEAERALAADPRKQFEEGLYPRERLEGLIARARGDQSVARDAFSKARPFLAESFGKRPDQPYRLMLLAEADAAIGSKDQALDEARRAITLQASDKNSDAFGAADLAVFSAQISAWCGQKEEAVTKLESLRNMPHAYHYGYLKLSPDWADLRGDARFEHLISSLAPAAGKDRTISTGTSKPAG